MLPGPTFETLVAADRMIPLLLCQVAVAVPSVPPAKPWKVPPSERCWKMPSPNWLVLLPKRFT